MQTYSAPLRDMQFVLHEVEGMQDLFALPAFTDFNAELIDSVLEEAARLCTEVLLPINASGDEEGCRLENGVVYTPKGFKEAYKTFAEGGWVALSAAPEWGGQGLPHVVGTMVEEMICACNLSFSLYPGLTAGATVAIEAHGSDEMKAFYLPKMVSGEWTGTMCLTEAHCGTDLGLLRTKATPNGDGTYTLDGSKIFISSGDHDLAENVVHLVLARLPDAPPGTRGISLFLAPKFLPDADGAPGARNGISVSGLEHKMGLKASATCQISLDGTKAWLVGEPHKGMAAMFTMMNTERVAVGVQGLGVGEAAYQGAVAYARERLQGRALAGAQRPDKPADPIIVHPDVRRMLMTMRVNNEGCRALAAWVGKAMDLRNEATTPEERQEADDLIALMTPVVKALFTDLASETANLGVQVYGGHGFIRDHGMEQYVRDVRITQIYEGTNGVQALDLVGRKMPANMGRALRSFFHPVADFIAGEKADPLVGKMVESLEKAFQALQAITGQLAQTGLKDPEEAGAAATEYLRLFGLVALAYQWARMAKAAAEKLPNADGDADFYRAKLISARFFYERILPQTSALYLSLKGGKGAMMEMPEAAF
jgi:alkylation response protein AidB-like acyl-CoA dehydrogenase